MFESPLLTEEQSPAPGEHAPALFLGVDVGSTTVKAVVLDETGAMLFSRYRRHLSEVRATVANMLREVAAECSVAGATPPVWRIALTGSGAISLATELNIPFVQEVIASGLYIRVRIPHADVCIELGGEDAKLTFFTDGLDQRMNETCAGGTGAFIDQMAAFIHTDAAGLNEMALRHKTIYPIASRCGVFAKTDILPLLNEGCSREDIAASIMQAVVNQTISGLARGRSIRGNVVFLGGPLAFLSSLRERFAETLKLSPEQTICPDNAEYFVALGAALYAQESVRDELTDLAALAEKMATHVSAEEGEFMPPLFKDQADLDAFKARHSNDISRAAPLDEFEGDAWLGFDSGSTTLKAVLIDEAGRLIHSWYGPNKGEPLEAAIAILREIHSRKRPGLHIKSTAVTGYGSALLLAGLRADVDEVETVAHFTGARFFDPAVSFIMDIGGQDIKCMRIRNGAIDRIQLNEACSAGCGSFIENFAQSLNMPLPEFVDAALKADNPVDLGTRCTVFMNSKVKQAQKDGAAVGDIAAGLSYSVIRNACFKVMKITNMDELGGHIVAQGGAFANDALLRALELQIERPIVRPAISGLMGAFGAALIAQERGPARFVEEGGSALLGPEEVASFTVKARTTRCKGCTNACLLTISTFTDGRRFISGNRCERGAETTPSDLPNLYAYKYSRLFDPYTPLPPEKAPRGTLGIPRALNMFENYPLWFTMLTAMGFRVELSRPSSSELFFEGYGTIPSQTVCYPAKLAHGHILDLIAKKVDAIFYPCLPRERFDFSSQHSNYNCPVVIGYPELLANNISELRESNIPLIHNFLPLDRSYLAKRLADIPFFSKIPQREIEDAVEQGFAALDEFKADMARAGEKALETLHKEGKFGIVLAGHPYHSDPGVHHGIAELITSCGMGVLTEDSVSHLMPDPGLMRVVDQWTYHSRLYRAGAFAAGTDNLAVMQLVSFGCGLDAITADQVEEIVTRKGRLYAQIKIDEGANLGPARIRIRSLYAAMRERAGKQQIDDETPTYKGSPLYTMEMRETHTVLIPQLSPIHFQFIETLFKAEGYKVEQLPDVSRTAIDLALKYVNNDACYPALVVIGQLLEALRSGKYDLNKIALMISQTGGGCRATNYIAFLRKALVDSGMDHIPIISFNMSGLEKNPGFTLNFSMLKRAIIAGYFGDVLMRLIHRVRPYELHPGDTQKLADEWAERCKEVIALGKFRPFHKTILAMIKAFDKMPLREEKRKPRVGLVGEILLKYHPDANNRAAEVVEEEGGEAVVSDIMDFMLYSFYDNVFTFRHLAGNWKGYLGGILGIAYLEFSRWSMRKGLKRSKRFDPPHRFSELRKKAKGIISLGHQTGEGWLLTAEMVELLESGVPNILCMQPFGCLPNHITGKGLLKELKRRYPDANIAAVDYDPGASEVNQINRIKLMMSVAK